MISDGRAHSGKSRIYLVRRKRISLRPAESVIQHGCGEVGWRMKYFRREIYVYQPRYSRPECPINVNVSAAGKLGLPSTACWNIYFAPVRQSGRVSGGRLSIPRDSFVPRYRGWSAFVLIDGTDTKARDEFRISNRRSSEADSSAPLPESDRSESRGVVSFWRRRRTRCDGWRFPKSLP